MLNKHYTTVLTLAILVTFGIIPKSLASSDKVQSDSSLEYHLTTVKEDSSTSDSNLKANSTQIYNYPDDLKDTLIAQDVSPVNSDGGSSTDQSQSTKLWLLILVIIIVVPFVGFFLLKSRSKPEQIDEEQTTSENLTSTEEIPSSIPQSVISEFAVDSIGTDKLTQEDANVEENGEEIDETIVETATDSSLDSSLLDDIQEQVEDAQIQSESDEQQSELQDSKSLEQLSSSENMIDAEEIINELLDISKPELSLTEDDDENLDTHPAEEFVVSEKVAQNQPDLSLETENISAETALEQADQVTDQELANISEWLNEKIDSNDKDVSVMDDFWNNISSITEEINAETIPEQTEKITDEELANISEWLDEKVSPNSNLSDLVANGVDNLTDLVEGTEQDSNEELLSNSFNLEEEQNYNDQTKEGISDLTSDFLEELLNEDSSKESKH